VSAREKYRALVDLAIQAGADTRAKPLGRVDVAKVARITITLPHVEAVQLVALAHHLDRTPEEVAVDAVRKLLVGAQ
jgi:hypothetical protein